MALLSQIAGSFAALFLAALFGYGLGRLGGRFVPRDDPERAGKRARRLLWVLMPATYVLSLFAMTAGGWLDAVSAIADRLPGAVDAFVRLAFGFGAPAAACLAAYLGVFPAVREARDLSMTTGAIAWMLARYLAGFVALVAVALLGTVAIVGALGGTAGLLAGVGVLLVVIYAASPLLVRALSATRSPTDAERERIEAAAETAGLSTRWIRVQETRGSEVATAFVRGAPGARILVVTDHLLDAVDDETLTAALALRAGRTGVYHTEIRVALAVGTVLAAGSPWLFSVPGPAVAVAAAALLAGALALWTGRRLVFRADDAAAERVGPDRVVDAIAEIVAINDSPRSTGVATAVRRMEPSVEARLCRLREQIPDDGNGAGAAVGGDR